MDGRASLFCRSVKSLRGNSVSKFPRWKHVTIKTKQTTDRCPESTSEPQGSASPNHYGPAGPQRCSAVTLAFQITELSPVIETGTHWGCWRKQGGGTEQSLMQLTCTCTHHAPKINNFFSPFCEWTLRCYVFLTKSMRWPILNWDQNWVSRDKSVELEGNEVGSPANLARKEMKCIACSHTIILQDDLLCAVFMCVFIQTCKGWDFCHNDESHKDKGCWIILTL